ncbi:hydroxymyristoyl-ACP dehydratase [Flavobacterium album]|uniref:Hydroxymyristoyl-ACP dehydratase n=1 Tax=Flavobacterium album TaxID=2175091 RepID=A0A2S1R0E7_9FLAO|nr:3-hydroxyacyl-ACP dehydratase FabZ family protein [Flavobacterium album]AWH86029.1 hydroxymyristoyl-ACP dehydratase [Flavobacterium album]
MNKNEILTKLPYQKPFLFVDELLHIDESGITGTYTFDKNLNFYSGHFKGHPVTPGVILTECMAQIGVVCLGIFLLNNELNTNIAIALTSNEIEFLKPVYPNEKVTVVSEKIYFRFGKLKCRVVMRDEAGDDVCKGTIAGLITNNK